MSYLQNTSGGSLGWQPLSRNRVNIILYIYPFPPLFNLILFFCLHPNLLPSLSFLILFINSYLIFLFVSLSVTFSFLPYLIYKFLSYFSVCILICYLHFPFLSYLYILILFLSFLSLSYPSYFILTHLY